jgi:hypothetical protein
MFRLLSLKTAEMSKSFGVLDMDESNAGELSTLQSARALSDNLLSSDREERNSFRLLASTKHILSNFVLEIISSFAAEAAVPALALAAPAGVADMILIK